MKYLIYGCILKFIMCIFMFLLLLGLSATESEQYWIPFALIGIGFIGLWVFVPPVLQFDEDLKKIEILFKGEEI